MWLRSLAPTKITPGSLFEPGIAGPLLLCGCLGVDIWLHKSDFGGRLQVHWGSESLGFGAIGFRVQGSAGSGL